MTKQEAYEQFVNDHENKTIQGTRYVFESGWDACENDIKNRSRDNCNNDKFYLTLCYPCSHQYRDKCDGKDETKN